MYSTAEPVENEWSRARTVSSAATKTAVLLFLGFWVLYACVARYVLDAFPFAGDEYSVALQAKLFARGMLKVAAPAHIEWLGVDHTLIDTWVRSKYPPGAAALLSLGERVGAVWVVNPILGVGALAVVWSTIRDVLGEKSALVGLVALGLAPLFAFHAASFYSHTAATLFLSIAFAMVAAWLQRPVPRGGSGLFVLCGAALGCAFLVRPFDALLFGVAMVSLRSVRAILVTAASALPFVGLNLLYQKAQYGSLFSDGYSLYAPQLGLIYGPQAAAPMLSLACFLNPLQHWFHLDVARAFIVDWTVPGTALVALLGAYSISKSHPARPMRTFCIALIAVFVAALLVTTSDPDDGARPRYLSTILVPVAFLAAAGYEPACRALEARFGRRVQRIIVVVTMLFGLGQFVAFLQYRVPLVWKREGVFQAAKEHGLHDAVVVVRAKFPTQYARNGPWFDGVLYLSAPPSTTVDEVAAAYPGRQVWEAFEGEIWRLVKFR